MLNHLHLGIRKREEVMKNCFEENIGLKEEIKSKNKLIDRLKSDLKQAHESISRN